MFQISIIAQNNLYNKMRSKIIIIFNKSKIHSIQVIILNFNNNNNYHHKKILTALIN